jgi:hypothetical protein
VNGNGRWWTAAAVAMLVGTTEPALALDNGAWRTFVRPVAFTDLQVTPQGQLFGATQEGGLLRWVPGADSFEVIRRQPGSITSNQLTRVAADRAGRLWAGSRASGASRLDPGASRWQVVTAIDGLPSDSVTVLEPQGDSLWVGTTQGVALWNGHEIAGALPDGITVSFDTTFALSHINGVAVLGDSVWLATQRGAGYAHLSASLTDWRPANQGLGAVEISELASDGQDLFARVGTAVYRYRPDLGQWVSQTAPGVTRTLTDEPGKIEQAVLAAADGGIYRWRPTAADTGWVRLADGVASVGGNAPDPALDGSGTLFVAAQDTLYEWSGGAWTAHPPPAMQLSNDLIHLAINGPWLYVTSNLRGFSRYDGASWRLWKPFYCSTGCDTDTTFIKAGNSFVVQVGAHGRVFVGSWSQPPTPQAFAPGGSVTSFLDFGTPNSFHHQFVVEDISQVDRMRHTWVLPGARDSLGRTWFGSETISLGDIDPLGLSLYDSTGVFLASYDETNGAQSKFVHGVAVTHNQRLWIGYDGNGLDFLPLAAGLPPASNFIHVTSTDGLGVRGVAARGDSVWVVTQTDVRLFESSANQLSQPSEILPLRGGQSVLGFQPLAIGLDGTLWAASLAGLRAFHPGGAVDSFTTANSPIPGDEVRSLAIDPRNGVLWLTTASGLASLNPGYQPPPAPPLPALHVQLYPNPVYITNLGFGLRMSGEAQSYRGEIYDLSGRLIRSYQASNGGVFWDGRDREGNLVKPGLYLVHATAGGQEAMSRVVVLH